MGIESHYNGNNPPPFHLNVNNPVLYGYPPNNDIAYDKNAIYQSKINEKNVGNKIKNKKVNNIPPENKITPETQKEKLKKDDFSIDINIISKNRVEVKIPINYGKNKNRIWQKEYNKKELIGTVINDYLIENELNLPDDYFSELKCFNKPVSFQDEINSLLPKEPEPETKKEEPQEKKEYQEYPEIIGKPFYDPFQILCFYKNQKKFVTLNYNKDLIDQVNIEKFNITSAYCNGYNHLYISGGENSLNNFWNINLKKNKINPPLKDMPPKKYHSMIFIPRKIVFIVGGNSLSTFYYNLKEKKLIKWGRLNIIRMEPALQVINNKLYCFDCSNLKGTNNEYSYEFTELNSEPKWKFIKPKINYGLNFSQQLFGVAKYKENNIIFLGGKFHNENYNNLKTNNFMLDLNKNEIVLSDVKYKKFNLKEKGFYPFNKTYDCILTDFPRSSPQICFFNKKKLKLELINFSSDVITKEENISNMTPIFAYDEKNKIINNTGLRNPNQIKGYNTMNIMGKTPDKNMYRIKKLNYPKTEVYTNERNSSYDSKKFYYPKIGLKTNKNLYNYYQSKNY